MSPEIVGGASVIILVLLILLRVQVGMALLLVGFVGYSILVNKEAALVQIGNTAFQIASSYSLSVMPMFILMGMFLSYSGLAKDLFTAVDRWIGHLRGGIGMATIGACALFSAISGSVSATTATIGRVALPEMDRYQYDQKISTACVAAGGTLGILIPPSVTLILYGVLTMEPIGQLLIAGIVPGIIMTILFMLTTYILIRRNPSLAPSTSERSTFRVRITSLKNVWPFLLVFIISIGGIYFGFFTPTEAGGVGAVGALLIAISSRSLSWEKFVTSVKDTVRITGMLFIILIGAGVYGKFLAISKVPMKLSTMVAGSDVSPYIILLIILLLYLILGLFMEGFAILVLTLPIVYPMIINLGFDGVWFGVIMILVLNMGLLTPPLGLSVYVISGIAKNIPIQTIFRGVMPMLLTIIVFTLILVIFPQIVTFLPNMMQ